MWCRRGRGSGVRKTQGMEPRTLKQELWMLVRNPGTTLICGIVVGGSALSLPGKTLRGGGTLVGSVLNSNPLLLRPLCGQDLLNWSSDAEVIRDGDVYRGVNPNQESWDEMSRLLHERPRDVFSVRYECRWIEQGIWAPTREGEVETIRVQPYAGTLATEELIKVRKVAAEYFGKEMNRDMAALGLGDVAWSRRLTKGYVTNLFVGLCAIGFVLSLGWVPGAWRLVVGARARGRLRRGQCVTCGYSMAGNASGVCPECGASKVVDNAVKEKDPGEVPGS